MTRGRIRLALWQPLVLWLPALELGRHWPGGPAADLPWLVWPFYAAFALGLAVGLPPLAGVATGVALVSGLWAGARLEAQPLGHAALLWLAGLLALMAVLSERSGVRRLPWARHLLAGTYVVCALFGLARCLAPEPTTAPAAEPGMFIPLEVDPTGERVLLLSFVDADAARAAARSADDPDALSLWSLDLRSGASALLHQGYPFFLADWAPDGRQVAFAASEQPWGDEPPAPFGVYVGAPGQPARARLRPPQDGSCWLYPQWSRHGNRLGAWLLPDVPELGRAAVKPLQDLPKCYVTPADQGPLQLVDVRGCRLSLLGAWQSDGEGLYAITERGLYLWTPDGKAKRLVPAGEAPLEPFPFVVEPGVSPAGKYLAYLDLVLKRGEIDRLDVKLVDQAGKRVNVMNDIVPLGLGWSRDGQVLATARRGRGDELWVQTLNPETRARQQFRTGLKMRDPEMGLRLLVSPDGHYAALNTSLEEGAVISIALLDLRTGKVSLPAGARMSLACGWRADGSLVLSDTQSVSVLRPDNGQVTRIYPRAAALRTAAARAELLRRALAQRSLGQLERGAAALTLALH